MDHASPDNENSNLFKLCVNVTEINHFIHGVRVFHQQFWGFVLKTINSSLINITVWTDREAFNYRNDYEVLMLRILTIETRNVR